MGQLHQHLVLFNHTFEYLTRDPSAWMHKALNLRRGGGVVLIFSPNRGGINQLYGDFFDPLFSEDLIKVLGSEDIHFHVREIPADCDISLLDEADDNPDKIRLLSFLTQVDCREITPKRREYFKRVFQALREPGGRTIPHPATLFII